jgi:hypothetical protein
VLLGLLSLTRPNGLIVMGLFLLWAIIMAWLKLLPRAQTLRAALLSALLGLAIIAPWTVRNYLVSHTFIPVATGDGTVMLGSYNNNVLNPNINHGEFLGTWQNPLSSAPQVTRLFPTTNCPATCEVRREDTYNQAAKQWILANKKKALHLVALHFINMWMPAAIEADLPMYRFPNAHLSTLTLDMMNIYPIPVMLLAAFGLVVTFFRWRELLFPYFIIAMTFALALYLYGIPRFRNPIEPMLILLATGALWWGVNAFRRPAPASTAA